MTSKMIFGLLVLLSLCNQLFASGAYKNGYVADGYTYRDNYWWLNSQSYSRVAENYRAVDKRGCYYTAVRYKYTVVPIVQSINPSVDEHWRAKLLEIAGYRDRYEGQARRSALEHAEFLETVQALGLQGNFAWHNYGQSTAYAQNNMGYYKQSYQQLATPQGSTVYGYSQVADIYGNVDLGAVYNQALRLRQSSRSYEAEGDAGTTALVDNLGRSAAIVAEIQAKGAAAAQALQAASAAQRSTVVEQYTAKTTGTPGYTGQTGGQQPMPPVDNQQNNLMAAAQSLINVNCVVCHSGARPNGGLVLADITALDDRATQSVLDRVIHQDPSKRMPLSRDLAPGVPLHADQIALLYAAAGVPVPQPGQQPQPQPQPQPPQQQQFQQQQAPDPNQAPPAPQPEPERGAPPPIPQPPAGSMPQ